MGKPSRDKGQRGEREFQATIQAMGINSRRLYTAQAVGLGVPDLITENQAGAISWEVKRTKLLRWAEWAKQRAEATQDPDAPRVAGEKQCRFCRAKASCQALKDVTEAAIMSDFDDLDNMLKANTLTDEEMRAALDAKPMIESWLSAIEKLAKARLEEGGGFVGYKLVEGRSNRRWISEGQASEELVNLLGEEDAYTKKLVSPAQAEKLLGKKRVSEIADIVVKSSGAPTLAPETDKRPAINLTVDDFNDCTD